MQIRVGDIVEKKLFIADTSNLEMRKLQKEIQHLHLELEFDPLEMETLARLVPTVIEHLLHTYGDLAQFELDLNDYELVETPAEVKVFDDAQKLIEMQAIEIIRHIFNEHEVEKETQQRFLTLAYLICCDRVRTTGRFPQVKVRRPQ